jgi:hypothetical protein
MRVVFQGSIPKGDTAGGNEDCFAWSERKQLFAISDGASVSFDSAAWSKILVRRFARNPTITREWVSTAAREFAGIHDRDSLSWNMQAAFDRGSFATLLGVQVDAAQHTISVTAIGDSVAVLVDNSEVLDSFPLSLPEQFDLTPALISTRDDKNEFICALFSEGRLQRMWSTLGMKTPEVFCMSDALAAWFLAGDAGEESPIQLLRALRGKRNLRRLIERETSAGRMRRDDVTLLRLR